MQNCDVINCSEKALIVVETQCTYPDWVDEKQENIIFTNTFCLDHACQVRVADGFDYQFRNNHDDMNRTIENNFQYRKLREALFR